MRRPYTATYKLQYCYISDSECQMKYCSFFFPNDFKLQPSIRNLSPNKSCKQQLNKKKLIDFTFLNLHLNGY